MLRHALRVSELIVLRWDQIDLKQGLLYVCRLKNGTPSNHPIRGPEIRALRRLKRKYPETPYVFVTERKGPLTASTARKLVARAGRKAKLPLSRPSTHAPSRLRLQVGERQPRYTSDSALSRAQEHHTHSAIYRASGGPIQRILEGLAAGIESSNAGLVSSRTLGKTSPQDPQSQEALRRLVVIGDDGLRRIVR